MSFLLRLLRAVIALGGEPPEPQEASAHEREIGRARERAAVTAAAPRSAPALEPRGLNACSLKVSPLDKGRVVRRVNRGGFTRIFVNTKERVRPTGAFGKQEGGPKAHDKTPAPEGAALKDLRARRLGSKKRPLLTLLKGGDPGYDEE